MVEVVTQEQSEMKLSYSLCMPEVVRVIDCAYELFEQGWANHLAHVFGDSYEMYVEWQRPFPEQRIQEGCLARVYWPRKLSRKKGIIEVVRLAPLEEPDGSVNLFETIPSDWLKNGEIIDRAKALIEQLPPTLRLLWNHVMWWKNDFRHYVTVPATLDDHHNGWGGNLRHAVEVAEHAERIALEVPGVSTGFLILSAMLHNLANVVPFTWMDGRWMQSGFGSWQSSRNALKVNMDAILKGHSHLLSSREHELLLRVMFSGALKGEGGNHNSIRAVELDILSLAGRLSREVNLNTQGGVN